MVLQGALKHYGDLGRYYLGGGMMVAIAEQHTKPHGRQLAEDLLRCGYVRRFFIEYYPGDHFFGIDQNNHRLRGILGGESDDLEADLDDTFSELVANDAQPNLRALAKLALEREIQVIAADPEIRKGASDSALKTRDEAACEYISREMQNAQRGSLLLWGERHFRTTAEKPGLHMQIWTRLQMPVMLLDVSSL